MPPPSPARSPGPASPILKANWSYPKDALAETAASVLTGALAAGAHYVDVGGEQAVLRAVYERHESAVRRAGLVALPGAGLDCAIGDLAAAWAAAHLCGVADPGEAVRGEPAPRLAEDDPIDEVAVSYVFDELALSAGSQRALFGALGTRALIWRRDRWEAGPAGDHRRINAGPALGGERDAQAFAGGDVLSSAPARCWSRTRSPRPPWRTRSSRSSRRSGADSRRRRSPCAAVIPIAPPPRSPRGRRAAWPSGSQVRSECAPPVSCFAPSPRCVRSRARRT